MPGHVRVFRNRELAEARQWLSEQEGAGSSLRGGWLHGVEKSVPVIRDQGLSPRKLVKRIYP